MSQVRELEALVGRRGRPLGPVSDNGTELTSLAMLKWAQDGRVEWHYIAPGKLELLIAARTVRIVLTGFGPR